MKTKILLVVGAMLTLGGAALVLVKPDSTRKNHPQRSSHTIAHEASQAGSAIVPAYQAAAEARNLGSTLAPAKFVGKTREAYQVAKEIPATLAQLPCYCHCDQSFGHKSLHTCFEDDHAAHCAVCVDEALLAFRLQKEQKMTPEQVREVIVEKYSRGQ